MAIKDIFKISRKTFFDPLTWLDYKSLKNINNILFRQLAAVFTIATPTRKESFEEAMQRFGLTESNLEEIKTNYRRFALLFLILGLLVFIFAFYLLFRYTAIYGFLIGLAVAALSFTQAFKYDFWAFQIKKRRLGCKFIEWKNDRLGN